MEKEKSEEKNDRYRQQGVWQTEVMDDLIKEMIFISKMDQEDLKLKQEEVSVLSIIEEQMDKLETLVDEKNLKVEYKKEEDWVIQGDKIYLEKAFFSILENAVAYNKPDGKIAIQISKESCAIENTADPIPEENLPHLCDLFFTSNKSRKSDVGHKGLGLYLAKRIFDMHKKGMRIENNEDGVKVIIH
jgi:signal transduction histidine kinase